MGGSLTASVFKICVYPALAYLMRNIGLYEVCKVNLYE